MSDQRASGPRSGCQRRFRSRLKMFLILGLAAAIVAGVAYTLYGPGESRPSVTYAAQPVPTEGALSMVNTRAQDFTVTGVDGKPVSLSSYKGQPVWLTFGATSCVPCKAEAPDVEAAYQRFKAKGGVVLAIFIREDSPTVRDYGERIGLTFPMATDPDSRIASTYRVRDWTQADAEGHHGFVTGFPAHFFINRSGVVKVAKTGSLTPEQMDAALAAISR